MESETSQTHVSAPERAHRIRVGTWSRSEHELYLQGTFPPHPGKALHDRDWIKIAHLVGTRTRTQVRSHDQKYENRL